MKFFYIFLAGCFFAPVMTVRLAQAAGNFTVALFHVLRIAFLLCVVACRRWGAKRVALSAGLAALLAAGLLGANAAHAGQVTCVDYQPQYSETYAIAGAGQPGLVFVAARDPNNTIAQVLTPSGWEQYKGGLYPFYARYDDGLPASVTIKSVLPNTDGTTTTELGWTIYVGYGALTPDSIKLVQSRRAALDAVKPQRVAAGTWNPSYDSDDTFKWALVQKNMTDNDQYQVSVETVPQLNCAPQTPGGN